MRQWFGLWFLLVVFFASLFVVLHRTGISVLPNNIPNITSIIKQAASSYVLQPRAAIAPTNLPPVRPCHWPPPLYNASKWKKMPNATVSATLYNLKVLYDAFVSNEHLFFYIDSGILLGLYRDGILGLDSDMDVRFGTTQKHLGLPSFKNVPRVPISMNNEASWGNLYSGYGYKFHKLTQQEVTETRAKICHPQHLDALSPHLLVLDEPWQRRFIESCYGALWFVRMPWKSDYAMLRCKNCAPLWKPVLAVMRRMDSNSDGRINDTELQAHVHREGGDMTHYKRQFTKSQRCRAVAKANWILSNGENYDKFVLPPNHVRGDHIPFWVFPECGVKGKGGLLVFER